MAASASIGRKITTVAAVAPLPITEEPRQEKTQKIRPSSRGGSVIGPEIEEASKLRGLSSLALANAIQIKVDNRWWQCDWDVRYSVLDGETETLIFNAVENISWCWSGNRQSILIRDHGKNLVARVCYKEKICVSKKLVMAVYAPVDILIGTIEECTGFLGPVEFMIRNSDGRSLFHAEYQSGPCSVGSKCCCPCAASTFDSHFSVKSCDTKSEVGKILEKTNKCLRLQFKTKLDITGKIILTGFCIGLIHTCYQISEQPTHE